MCHLPVVATESSDVIAGATCNNDPQPTIDWHCHVWPLAVALSGVHKLQTYVAINLIAAGNGRIEHLGICHCGAACKLLKCLPYQQCSKHWVPNTIPTFRCCEHAQRPSEGVLPYYGIVCLLPYNIFGHVQCLLLAGQAVDGHTAWHVLVYWPMNPRGNCVSPVLDCIIGSTHMASASRSSWASTGSSVGGW